MGLFGSADQARARFYGSLATTLDAGLPADQALALVEGAGDLAAAVRRLGQTVRRGRPLAEGMARHGSFWSRFEVDSMAAGERAGRLPETLRRLADYFETRGRTRDRIGFSLIYPSILLNAAILLPPLYLLFLDGIGAYSARVGPILLAVYGVVGALWWLWRIVTSGAHGGRVERHLLSLPLVGRIVHELALADYAYVSGVLQATGTPLVEALTSAAGSSRLALVRGAGGRVAAAVGEGATVCEALAREPGIFPQFFVEAIRVGEVSGTLDDALARIERTSRAAAEQALERLTVILPIAAYVVAGIVVAWVVIRSMSSILMP
ncbi:MAG: hypothetical protein GY856_45435 [bacterium]|nr:hypothetical protein [bacterium]